MLEDELSALLHASDQIGQERIVFDTKILTSEGEWAWNAMPQLSSCRAYHTQPNWTGWGT